MFDSLRPHGLQHTRPPCPSLTPRACSNSCPLSQWRHPAISSSVIPFSSCLQSFPASRSFSMSQFFESSCQSIGASATASVLPMNIQDWFPLGWTGLTSLPSKGLSRVFSSTTINGRILQSYLFSFIILSYPSLLIKKHQAKSVTGYYALLAIMLPKYIQIWYKVTLGKVRHDYLWHMVDKYWFLGAKLQPGERPRPKAPP